MKNLLLGLLTLTVIGVSCSKNQVVTEPVTKTTSKKTRKPKPTATLHYEKFRKDCIKPALNCASTVVIRPHLEAFKELDIAISSGQSAVTTFFNTPNGSLLISEYFGDDYLTVLQNGSYTMISDYNNETLIKFYLLGLASTLTLDNAELVIPATVE